jgi:DNA-binding LacI/PurR family transcriptional regulator
MLNDDESLLNTRVQHGPPGIIAANDVLANIVLEILQEHGLTLGSDYGLVGFDGSPLARMGQFTSVRPSFEVLGKLAGLLILQALQGYSLAIQTRVQPEVVQRTSTKRHRSPS